MLTTGTMMFYGGILGIAVAIILLFVILSKKTIKDIEQEDSVPIARAVEEKEINAAAVVSRTAEVGVTRELIAAETEQLIIKIDDKNSEKKIDKTNETMLLSDNNITETMKM